MQHEVATIYSNSAVESEIEDCFLLNHATKQFPKKNVPPIDVFVTLECIHLYILCIVPQCLFQEVSIM